MKRIYLLIPLIFCFITSQSQVQDSLLFDAYQSIRSDDLKNIVYDLASPEMEGRGPGTVGIERASKYISGFLKNKKIDWLPPLNGYLQKVDFQSVHIDNPIVTIGDKVCTEHIDYIGQPSTIISKRSFDIVIVQNISLEDIQKLDIQSKTLLILTPNIFFDKKPLYDLLIKKGCRGVMLCNPVSQNEFKKLSRINSARRERQIERNKRSFAGSVQKSDSLLNSLVYKRLYLSTLVVSPQIASRIVGYDVKTINQNLNSSESDSSSITISKIKISAKQDMVQIRELSNNILGYIEGSELKDEVVVLSAHYDHLGKYNGKIMRGADDNASGVATIMEIAEAYTFAIKKGFQPKRSIVFAAFTAEEKGLWGSWFFVNKIDSLKIKPIIDLNADMVGRGEDNRVEKNSSIKKVYIITSKKDSLILSRIRSIELGSDTLKLDYSLVGNKRSLSDSDHASFIKMGIPAVMFFRGLHPDYHTIRDTPEKLDYETLERVTRLIFKISIKYVQGE